MVSLKTPTVTYELSADDPYYIERVTQRYFFIAEFVKQGGAESIQITIYDGRRQVDVVTPRRISAVEASRLWQIWYGLLAT